MDHITPTHFWSTVGKDICWMQRSPDGEPYPTAIVSPTGVVSEGDARMLLCTLHTITVVSREHAARLRRNGSCAVMQRHNGDVCVVYARNGLTSYMAQLLALAHNPQREDDLDAWSEREQYASFDHLIRTELQNLRAMREETARQNKDLYDKQVAAAKGTGKET